MGGDPSGPRQWPPISRRQWCAETVGVAWEGPGWLGPSSAQAPALPCGVILGGLSNLATA